MNITVRRLNLQCPGTRRRNLPAKSVTLSILRRAVMMKKRSWYPTWTRDEPESNPTRPINDPAEDSSRRVAWTHRDNGGEGEEVRVDYCSHLMRTATDSSSSSSSPSGSAQASNSTAFVGDCCGFMCTSQIRRNQEGRYSSTSSIIYFRVNFQFGP